MDTNPTFLKADDPEIIEELFGSFPGNIASAARLEQLLAISIKRKHMENLNTLSETAWWDYRPLSLGHGFMLFVVERIKTVKTLAAGKGILTAKGYKKGINVQPLMNQSGALVWDYDNRDITALWKSKCAADTFGIPYGKFIELSIRTALDDGYTRFPEPNQWYNEKRLIRTIDAWDEVIRTGVSLAKHPIYDLANYQGHRWQDAYQDWLLEQIGRRTAPTRALANVLYHTPQLSEQRAADRYGVEEVERAKSLFERESY